VIDSSLQIAIFTAVKSFIEEALGVSAVILSPSYGPYFKIFIIVTVKKITAVEGLLQL
jgi:hypothetical protein